MPVNHSAFSTTRTAQPRQLFNCATHRAYFPNGAGCDLQAIRIRLIRLTAKITSLYSKHSPKNELFPIVFSSDCRMFYTDSVIQMNLIKSGRLKRLFSQREDLGQTSLQDRKSRQGKDPDRFSRRQYMPHCRNAGLHPPGECNDLAIIVSHLSRFIHQTDCPVSFISKVSWHFSYRGRAFGRAPLLISDRSAEADEIVGRFTVADEDANGRKRKLGTAISLLVCGFRARFRRTNSR
jgi:hypothetical protein